MAGGFSLLVFALAELSLCSLRLFLISSISITLSSLDILGL